MEARLGNKKNDFQCLRNQKAKEKKQRFERRKKRVFLLEMLGKIEKE